MELNEVKKEDRHTFSVANEFHNQSTTTKKTLRNAFLFVRFFHEFFITPKERFKKQGDWPYHFDCVSFVLYTTQVKRLIF